jgi:hypothetical protein
MKTKGVAMDDIPTKTCRSCQEIKPLSDFHRNAKFRDGYQYSCKKCACAKTQAYYRENAEKQRENAKDRRSKNNVVIREKARRHYQENREMLKERRKGYYLQNRDAVIEKSKQYYYSHYEQRRATIKVSSVRWKRANPDAIRVLDSRRRARKIGNGGSHTVKQWLALKAQYDHRCLCCGKQEPNVVLTEDHVVPIAKGGTDNIDNIQPLCLSCNCSKQAKHTDYRPSS